MKPTTAPDADNDDWQTPSDLWDALNRQYDFSVDLAANAENAKCDNWWSLNGGDSWDGNAWEGTAWCNPPFSKAEAFFKAIANADLPCVAIYKSNNMETKAWAHVFRKAEWIAQPHHRVRYEGRENVGQGAKFPSALIGFKVDAPRTLDFPFTLLRVHR